MVPGHWSHFPVSLAKTVRDTVLKFAVSKYSPAFSPIQFLKLNLGSVNADAVVIQMFGFRTPFPVRLNLPQRRNSGEMLPMEIRMVGHQIRIKYAAARKVRFRWDWAATHEMDWFPELQTREAIIQHFVEVRTASRRVTKQTQIKLLSENAEFLDAGVGTKVMLTCEMTGLKIAGGSDSIYLLSEQGKTGALRIWTNSNHSYDLDEIEIGSGNGWPTLPTLSEDPFIWQT